jgi:hypothetical protein
MLFQESKYLGVRDVRWVNSIVDGIRKFVSLAAAAPWLGKC